MKIRRKHKHGRRHIREQNQKHDDKKGPTRCCCWWCVNGRTLPTRMLDLHDQEDEQWNC